jgi:carboxyl-terminal processing protease
MTRMRVGSRALIALLVMVLAIPVLPRAEAADAQFVLSTLDTLQENYVDPLPSVQMLNAALDALRQKLNVAPFGGAIPNDADDRDASALFTQRFDEILSQVHDQYSTTQLAYIAVAGMLASLHDSHTGFIPPELYQEEKRKENGEAAFTGIGIVLLLRDGQFYVNEVYPGGPAASAGVRPFDRILAVDGKSTTGLDETAVSGLVRGTAGSTVVLTLGRPGADRPQDVSIVRAPIHVPRVTAQMLTGQIGYIRIFEFVPGVGNAFRDAILSLRREGMRALVLDLRGNPGGLVEELRDVADAMLPQSSPFLQMKTRGGRQTTLETHDPPILPASDPLAVLVDDETGSAAELLSAAIQEQSRGVITGIKTAGAVEIGITVDLPEGAGMSVTVARVLSGRGTRLEGQGVTPDDVMTLTTDAMNLGHDSQLDKAVQLLRDRLSPGSIISPDHRLADAA